MSVGDFLILLVAGLCAGVINSVSSGGSFFTYPAMLLTGMPSITAAATTLVALTPGNVFAVPEYWPEFQANKDRYPKLVVIVMAGASMGTALLLAVGADVFDSLVPWLILVATLLFWLSPRIATWAQGSSPTLTSGALGSVLLFITAVYLTFFGSGSGNIFLALLLIQGFGDFFSANVAKNIVMTIGGVIAIVVYAIAGLIAWLPVIPVAVGSAIGARVGSRWARRLPISYLRAFVIVFGFFVAGWRFLV
jgi:uncharacterized membrane protein YfcA